MISSNLAKQSGLMFVSLLLMSTSIISVFCEEVKNNAGSFTIDDQEITVEGETIREVTRFNGIGDTSVPEDFKILMMDNGQMLVGARNRVYVLSLSGLNQKDVIEWSPSEVDVQVCQARYMKTKEECQNYIRVIVKKSQNGVFICGTNAFKPWCRTYNKENDGYSNFPVEDQNGIGKCPFDPKYNNTAIFSGQRLISGTVTDYASRDALIYGKPIDYVDDLPELRTEQFSSEVLNEPNFVSSYEFEDKVYFFFRETAVEAINCGKTVYSRVGRVCKNDQGGEYLLQKSWTSFFKSRLNCSMPGSFPFYFDEIQSTSSIGQGNYMPSITVDNRTDMVYAVFNTPENSIHGSAVCAFRFKDIVSTFEGPFKEKKNPSSNWLQLPKAETPHPHPAKSCSNGSLSDPTKLNFIKSHPLMDTAVPTFGGKPLLVQTSFQYRLTEIAVDWQVYAADNKRYDVLFIGTTDGRVVKAINKGGSPDHMNTVVVEDIQVFDNKAPVVNIKVNSEEGRLLVVSKHEIKSILLQRCHLQDSCSACVALQDPYCSWHNGVCRYSRNGHQSIDTAKHHACKDGPTTTKKVSTTPSAPTICEPCPVCTTPPLVDKGATKLPPTSAKPTTANDRRLTPFFTTEMSNEIPQIAEPNTGARHMAEGNARYAAHDMAMAIVFTLIIALVLGIVIGYIASEKGFKIHFKKSRREQNNTKYDMDSQKGKNKNLEKRIPEKNDNRYENPQNLNQSNHQFLNLTSIQPNTQQNTTNSLNSLDSRPHLHVVVNDISGKKSPGRERNENIETSVSPSKLSKQVYL